MAVLQKPDVQLAAAVVAEADSADPSIAADLEARHPPALDARPQRRGAKLYRNSRQPLDLRRLRAADRNGGRRFYTGADIGPAYVVSAQRGLFMSAPEGRPRSRATTRRDVVAM